MKKSINRRPGGTLVHLHTRPQQSKSLTVTRSLQLVIDFVIFYFSVFF